eukprot:UN10402
MRNCKKFDSEQVSICNFCSKDVFICRKGNQIKEIFGKCSKLIQNVYFYYRYLFFNFVLLSIF